MARIAPSILAADFGNMRADVQEVIEGGCQLLHVDVMDGHFVPNISMGSAMVSMLRKSVEIPLDVHLMIEDPERYLQTFYEAGADRPGSILTVHLETCPHIHRTIEMIHRLGDGILAGCAINPGTPVSLLEPIISDLDLVLVMSVDPGFGGQAAIESCIDKVTQVRRMAEKVGKKLLIEVDGGIKLDNMGWFAEADILVMGSAVFNKKGAKENMRAAQEKLDQLWEDR